jgi:hypothetical protein
VDRAVALDHAIQERPVVVGEAAHMKDIRAVEVNNANQDTNVATATGVRLPMVFVVGMARVVPERRAAVGKQLSIC